MGVFALDEAQKAGLTVTVMVAAAGMFDRVLPPAHEVAGRPATASNIATVRAGCMRTAPLVLSLGVGVSLMTKSWAPFLGVAGMVAWMCWQYDDAAKHHEPPPATVGGTVRGRFS